MLMSVIVIIVSLLKSAYTTSVDEESLLDRVLVTLGEGVVLAGLFGAGYAYLANYLLDDELF